MRDGFLIPDEFRGGEYLEGVGEGTRVSLRLPVLKDLLARASRTWPGTIFGIFSNTEPHEPIPSSPVQPRAQHQFISITPTTEDDKLLSTDEDWIYPPTPPRLPSLELPVTQQLENLHADDSPPPGLIENTAEDYEIMRIQFETAAAANNQSERSATNNKANDAQLSPPAIEYLSDDETLQDKNTDEMVCYSLSPACAIHDASSPPPIQSDTSSEILSTPPSYSHLIPRGGPLPLGALDNLSNVRYSPNPSALQIKIINHRLAHPPSYLKRIIEVTL